MPPYITAKEHLQQMALYSSAMVINAQHQKDALNAQIAATATVTTATATAGYDARLKALEEKPA